MNHLEKLTRQYYEWQGYLVKGNIKVDPREKGGWNGELDVIAYEPNKNHLIHIEASLDAYSWKKREERFRKKFQYGREHIYKDIFPWLKKEDTPLEQKAILIGVTKDSKYRKLGEGEVVSVDTFIKEITDKIYKENTADKGAIPEEFDLLRTIQFVIKGYKRTLSI